MQQVMTIQEQVYQFLKEDICSGVFRYLHGFHPFRQVNGSAVIFIVGVNLPCLRI